MSKHTPCSKGLQSNPKRRDGSYQGRWKKCVPTCKSMWTHTHSGPRGNTESFPSHFRSTGPWPKPPPTSSLNDTPDSRFAVHRADPPSQGSYQKVPRKQLIWRRSIWGAACSDGEQADSEELLPSPSAMLVARKACTTQEKVPLMNLLRRAPVS